MKKNFFKIIISFTLIFTFSSTLIFCCDFQEAQASTLEHCGHNQAEKADHQHDSHSSHDCMCQQTFIADFSKSFSIQLESSNVFNKFLKDVTLGRSFNPALLSQATLLVDRSPPFLITAVLIPLYLKNSNLRL